MRGSPVRRVVHDIEALILHGPVLRYAIGYAQDLLLFFGADVRLLNGRLVDNILLQTLPRLLNTLIIYCFGAHFVGDPRRRLRSCVDVVWECQF